MKGAELVNYPSTSNEKLKESKVRKKNNRGIREIKQEKVA